MQSTISYDESGELWENCIFSLIIPFDVPFFVPQRPQDVHRFRAEKYPRFYADVLFTSEVMEACPHNNSHTVRSKRVNHYADVYGGDIREAFISDTSGLSVVVSEELARAIEQSSLVGMKLLPLKVDVNQSEVKDPQLYVVEFCGAACLRPRKIHIPSPNTCPFCKSAEVVCPHCYDCNYNCPTCGRELFVQATKRTSKSMEPFDIDEPSAKGPVIEGRLWDGSDFISGPDQGFVTGRVVKCLCELGVTSFSALQCRVDVTGMSEAMQSKLSAVASKVLSGM